MAEMFDYFLDFFGHRIGFLAPPYPHPLVLVHATQNNFNVTLKKIFHHPPVAVFIPLHPPSPSVLHVETWRLTGQPPSDSQSPDCWLLPFPSSQKAAGLSIWADSAPVWSPNICLTLLTSSGSKKSIPSLYQDTLGYGSES